jgi:hypothetical protein
MGAPVIFHWKGPGNERFQGEGVTRDMSVAGTFVFTPTCPPPNAVVQMEVFLPLSSGEEKALMKAEVKVLRVEHDIAGNKGSGFSALAKGFSLRTSSGRGSRLVAELIKEFKEPKQGQE